VAALGQYIQRIRLLTEPRSCWPASADVIHQRAVAEKILPADDVISYNFSVNAH